MHFGVISLVLLLGRTTAEVDTLAPLPCLASTEEQSGLDKHDAPFPGDTGVSEDVVVDDGDVENWEDGDESSHDGPEQELVAPHVVHPLGEVFIGVGLHAEEAAAHVDHLPGEEQSEPG